MHPRHMEPRFAHKLIQTSELATLPNINIAGKPAMAKTSAALPKINTTWHNQSLSISTPPFSNVSEHRTIFSVSIVLSNSFEGTEVESRHIEPLHKPA